MHQSVSQMLEYNDLHLLIEELWSMQYDRISWTAMTPLHSLVCHIAPILLLMVYPFQFGIYYMILKYGP